MSVEFELNRIHRDIGKVGKGGLISSIAEKTRLREFDLCYGDRIHEKTRLCGFLLDCGDFNGG